MQRLPKIERENISGDLAAFYEAVTRAARAGAGLLPQPLEQLTARTRRGVAEVDLIKRSLDMDPSRMEAYVRWVSENWPAHDPEAFARLNEAAEQAATVTGPSRITGLRRDA